MNKSFITYLPLIFFTAIVVGVGYLLIGTGKEVPLETPPKIVAINPNPEVSPSPPTATFTPTDTPSPPTATPTATPTHTLPPPPTATPLPTSTDTPTTTPSSTPTATMTPPNTPTPLPTATPTPTVDAMVVANELNLRTGPGTEYEVVRTLKQGDSLDIQGRSPINDWIQVIPTNLETLGWVSGAPNLVQINVDLTPIPVVEILPPPTLSVTPTLTASIKYLAPTLTNPDNGVGTQGTFPPLYWQWDGQLAEDEYFEVRVWFEELPYHAALGWVKQPQFDYNVSGERNGKYFWTVVIVKDIKDNVRFKDWYKPEQWPYPVYEHNPDVPTDSIQILSLESEPRFFFFTPNKSGGGSGGPISNPPPCEPGRPGC